MITTAQQRAEAKLKAAIASMKPAMRAASDAAHELMALNDDEDNNFDRVMMLGLISQILGELCPAQAKVLWDPVREYFLDEESHTTDEGESVVQRAH